MRSHSFNACYQLLCISLLFRNSRKPPRLEPVARPLLSTASVSFLLDSHPFVSPRRPASRCALSASLVVPAASYPTRCFINENEGASYIFLTRGESARPLSSILLSIHRGSLFLPTLLFPFSPTFSPPRQDEGIRHSFLSLSLFLSFPLYSPSLALSPAAVILLFIYIYRTGLSGECDNELCARN